MSPFYDFVLNLMVFMTNCLNLCEAGNTSILIYTYIGSNDFLKVLCRCKCYSIMEYINAMLAFFSIMLERPALHEFR